MVGLAANLMVAGSAAVSGQELRGTLEISAAALDDTSSLRRFEALVETLAAGGELVLASSRRDAQIQGRRHQFFQQQHEGVPVYGAGVSRQQAGGATVSLLGAIETGIEVDPRPRFQSAEALERLEHQAGVGALSSALPELVIVQIPSGRYVLAYRATMRDLRTYFLDARSGLVAHDVSAMREQSVGAGNGIQGQQKKLSTSRVGGTYQSYDRLRPAEIITLDLRYDFERVWALLLGDVVWASSDVASDADNVWTDPAVVDGHAYVGLTYDYLATRQGWHGVDGQNGRVFSMVNIERSFFNAFFAPPPIGPEGLGVVAFGEAEDGSPLVSADTVAHEVMHGVTYHSTEQRTGVPLTDSYWSIPGPPSFTLEVPVPIGIEAGVHECGQSYTWDGPIDEAWNGRTFRFQCREGRFALIANEGGAIHESWSDMFAAAVEFMVHEPPQGPLRADYELGEDTQNAIRSLERAAFDHVGRGRPSHSLSGCRKRYGPVPGRRVRGQRAGFLFALYLPGRREHHLHTLHLLRRRPLELHGAEPRVLPRDRERHARDERSDGAGRGRRAPPRYRESLLPGHDGADAAACKRGDRGDGGSRRGARPVRSRQRRFPGRQSGAQRRGTACRIER